jgi:GNAT superfamily N-acetyltransferase
VTGVRVTTLSAEEVNLVSTIDRSEHVDVEYTVIDGRLTERPAAVTEVPPWDATGSGPHSVGAHITFCASLIANGAVLLGAFDAASPAGIAVVDPTFEPPLAWLAFLHVSRPHRRRGAGQALWNEAVDLASAAGAASMYVSATPTGSAVRFYLRQGCLLANPPHPVLLAQEPEDIHFVRPLP